MEQRKIKYMTTPNLYIPDYSLNLKTMPSTQIRLGIQGYPGTGKTWASLTSPFPIIANFDNKLTAHKGRDIPVIPFNDPQFLKEILKMDLSRGPAGHDGLKRWLEKDGQKLTEGQTLVIDSWSSAMDSIETWWFRNPSYYKNGELEKWAPYNAIKAFTMDTFSILKQLKCNVIVIFHETVERDDDNKLTGKLKPLMSGQMADKLAGYFTDWFRQLAIPQKEKDGKDVIVNGNYKLKEPVEYFWQIQTDAMAVCCTSLAGVKNKFVRADFKRVFIEKNFEL